MAQHEHKALDDYTAARATYSGFLHYGKIAALTVGLITALVVWLIS